MPAAINTTPESVREQRARKSSPTTDSFVSRPRLHPVVIFTPAAATSDAHHEGHLSRLEAAKVHPRGRTHRSDLHCQGEDLGR
ncbi:hypothetical protein XA68_14358 [Ophiocordyceps unilateralis]|uniref:Uncharacterized protein n=1 Tax=Ophiocordyceps unilateralis TaxID=268505 RepID=A0A2A9PAK7_OPHUN|nr:hypothetical protein XA68_14358 [Ophiocordyceps unilateralis]